MPKLSCLEEKFFMQSLASRHGRKCGLGQRVPGASGNRGPNAEAMDADGKEPGGEVAGEKRKRSDEDGDKPSGGELGRNKRQTVKPPPQKVDEEAEKKKSEVEKRAVEFWAMAPDRVKEAAQKSRDFGEFKRNRKFEFIHLFSGPKDNLATALIEGAKRAGIEVRCRRVDIKIDGTNNLRDAERWKELGNEVDSGSYDGMHGGFPCGSFSRVGWREAWLSTTSEIVGAPVWSA